MAVFGAKSRIQIPPAAGAAVGIWHSAVDPFFQAVAAKDMVTSHILHSDGGMVGCVVRLAADGAVWLRSFAWLENVDELETHVVSWGV